MFTTMALPTRKPVSFVLIISNFLTILSLFTPVRAHAGCVQLQSYPPQTVCTDDNGVITTGGVVSTDASGSVTTNTSSSECYQLATYPPQTVCPGEGGGGVAPGSTSPSSSAAFGPVAFWKFDETTGTTAYDSSGNGNNGVLENGATRYTGVVQGNKLELDGVDDRVRVNTVSSNILNMDSFTLMAWIRPTEYGGIIIRKGNTAAGRFSFGLRSDGVLYFRAGYSEHAGSWQTTQSLPLNTWSHVAVTYVYGTGNKPTIYLNGIAQTLRSSVENPGTYDPANPVGTPIADTPYLYIGHSHDFSNSAMEGFDSAFEGRMDNVRVYNSVLSAAAIVAAKSPEPEAHSYATLPPVQQPDGTWIQPLNSTPTTGAGNADVLAILQRQVQELLAQIALLQGSGDMSAGVSASVSNSAACPVINRTLMRGMSGDDLRQLQRFLIARGFLAAGNDTGYFGALTEAAVQAFQRQSGILSSGSSDSNGYGVVGPQTRAAFARMCQ